MSTADAFPALPDFSYPVFVTGSGDGTDRLFVVQQSGEIYVFPNAPAATQLDLSLFLDLRDAINSGPGEAGLLSVGF